MNGGEVRVRLRHVMVKGQGLGVRGEAVQKNGK